MKEIIPLEAYLEFANELIIEDCGLGYDAAVVVAKALHRRKILIPWKNTPRCHQCNDVLDSSGHCDRCES